MKLRSFFLMYSLINRNQGPCDFLMLLNCCGVYLMQFFIQKGLERNVFHLENPKVK